MVRIQKTPVGIEVGRIQDDEDRSANTFRVHFRILRMSACFGFSDFSDLLHFPDFHISAFFTFSHFCLGYVGLDNESQSMGERLILICSKPR